MTRALATAMALVACGAKSSPSASSGHSAEKPVNATPASKGSTDFVFANDKYRVDFDANVESGSYDDVRLVGKAFTLELALWPESAVFVQTAAELEKAARDEAPELRVLHSREVARGSFELVYEAGGVVDGSVLHSGRGDGILCGIKVKGEWKSALAACKSLRPVASGEGAVRVRE